MVKVSTGARNQMLGSKSLRDILNFGCCKLNLYSDASPATADAAASGQLLATITRSSLTAKAKQKIRVTPTPGTANAAEWNITLNGVKITFIDDGTPTAAEICTGLYNAIRAAINTTAFTTPACKLNIPDIYGMFTLTDNTGTLDIEAATAGISFDITVSVSGAGAGTGSMATATQTEDAYGLHFEASGDIADGILQPLSTETWSGLVLAKGTVGYGRFVLDGDTGGASTTEPRLQGQCAVSASDINLSHIDVEVGETVTVKTGGTVTFPASKA